MKKMEQRLFLGSKAVAFLLCALSLASAPAHGADGRMPLIREGAQWVNYMEDCSKSPIEEGFYCYEFRGDTLIDGVQYHKCLKFKGENPDADASGGKVAAYLREENRVVTGWRKHDGVKETYILYDFDHPENMEQIVVQGFNDASYFTTDEVTVNGHPCKRHIFEYRGAIIDGIGFSAVSYYDTQWGDLLQPFQHLGLTGFPGEELRLYFLYLREGGEVIYTTPYNDTYSAVSDITAERRGAGDGRYYNLMGQPVAHPEPGIYIRNGKKVVVR